MTVSDFRKTAPQPLPPIAFSVPGAFKTSLDNGLRIVVVQDNRLPLVSYRLAFNWGDINDPDGQIGVTSAMVFCRSREGLSSPDLQLLFTPASYAQGVFRQLEHEPGMTVAVCPVRPESRGTIMAQSPDPLQYPAIRPNYLSAPNDLRVLIAGVAHTRKIFGQPAMAPRGRRQQRMPPRPPRRALRRVPIPSPPCGL